MTNKEYEGLLREEIHFHLVTTGYNATFDRKNSVVFIKDGTIMSTDDTAIMRSLVEQIVVRETEIEIEFKCGVTIRQEYFR